jgi:hypothetical protein
VIYIAVPYIICPIYDFPVTKAFAGDSIYNPYKNAKRENWLKGNFHCHSNAWGFLMNGRGKTNTVENIINKYKSLGYDIVCVSDYQHISVNNDIPHLYVRAYEHAMGPLHLHHLVLGAKYVSWFDFLGYEGLSQKQFMLNHLSESALLPIIAHPKFTGSYKAEDFRYICNYHVLEVFNRYRFSVEHWDTALSTGHAAFLIADDDCHFVDDPSLVQRCFTMVNTADRTENGIIEALKAGSSYGVDFNMRDGETFDDKIADAKRLKTIKSVRVHNNILTVTYPEKMDEIKFIGQNGVIKDTFKDTDSASYALKPTDTYIRTMIKVKDLGVLYLNPVIRYNGKALPYYTATVNVMKTILYRMVVILIFLMICFFIVRKMVRIIQRPLKRKASLS